MEEHIGKRVNTERTEEAMDTGLDDRHRLPVLPRDDHRRRRRRRRGQRHPEGRGARRGSAAAGLARQELRDAAREGHRGQRSRGARRPRRGGSTHVEAPAEAQVQAEPAAQATPLLTMSGDHRDQAGHGPRHRRRREASGRQEGRHPQGLCPQPKPPRRRKARRGSSTVKGLGIAGWRQAPRGQEGRRSTTAEAPTAEAAAPAEPAAEPEVKGLGIAAGARRPGAKKAAPKPAPEAAVAAARGRGRPARGRTGSTRQARARGQGPGHRSRCTPPGAKKAAPAAAAETCAPQPDPEADGEASLRLSLPRTATAKSLAAPVKGLGIAKGARPPGKR